MTLRRVRTVGPGDAMSSREWNKLAENVASLENRAALPTPGTLRFRTARTSDGTISDGDRMAWPDEPDEAIGIDRTDDNEGVRLDTPGLYFVIAQVCVSGDMDRGTQATVLIAEHGNRDSQLGSNSYKLPNRFPMVQATATLTITDPIDVAAWWLTDSTETMPIYTQVNRTSLTVVQLAPWEEADTDAAG